MHIPQNLRIRREDVITLVTKYRTITIDIDDYPELNGLSEQEMKDFIRKHGYEMRGLFYNSLGEDIEFSDIVSEEIESEHIDWVFTDEN
jgi:hypothetical protein